MKPKENNNSRNSLNTESQVASRPVSSRLSFKDALAKARAQINIDCFSEVDKSFANEIIFNIAEVYMLWDSAPVKIAGEQIDGYIIKQVFEELHEEHVKLVISNFSKVDYIVNYKKAYIRTALYNSVFEYTAYFENLVSATLYRND